jgi:hypothetical protein
VKSLSFCFSFSSCFGYISVSLTNKELPCKRSTSLEMGLQNFKTARFESTSKTNKARKSKQPEIDYQLPNKKQASKEVQRLDEHVKEYCSIIHYLSALRFIARKGKKETFCCFRPGKDCSLSPLSLARSKRG